MKILFMNPALNDTTQATHLYPSTFLTLGSMLGSQPRMGLGPVRGVGVAIETIHGIRSDTGGMTTQITIAELTAALKSHQPDVVAMSVFDDNLLDVKWVCQKLRELNPDLKIIIGGHLATLLPITTLNETGADLLLRGEADLSIRELMEALVSGGEGSSLLGIPGLFVRDHSGEILSSSASSEIPILRSEYLEKITYDMELLERSIGCASTVSIVGSRGCGFGGCSFCSVNIQQKLRRISDERTIEILKDLYQFVSVNGRSHIMFGMSDPAFGGTKKGLIRLLDKMCGSFDASHIGVNLAVDQLLESGKKGGRKPSLEIIQKLVYAGISRAELGVESFSDDLLNRIKCGRYTGEEASNVIIELARAGIGITLDSILTDFRSIMPELRTHIKLMLKTIMRVGELISDRFHISDPNQYILPFPGTRYYNEMLAAHNEPDWASGKIKGNASIDSGYPYHGLLVGIPDAISDTVELGRIAVALDAVNFHHDHGQLIRAGLADDRLDWFCDQVMYAPESVILSFLLLQDCPSKFIIDHYTEKKKTVPLPLLGK
ncbi:B12-binding domain-containing radical SAM protein [Candidatus Micrarchaeota archaeon]|nr:B12-binding domain-containing radical SAM protein [Candidatus Micrarchaeota archaeon]